MLDISKAQDGQDLTIANTITPKAANILAVQLGALEYAQSFGVDLKFFLQSDFQFQNESFKAYLVQKLTENQVNVNEVTEIISSLYETFVFKVAANENDTSLIAG